MTSERPLGSCLTVTQAGELLTVAEEKLNLEPRDVVLDQFATIQLQIGRGQGNVTRLVRLFPIDENHHAQAALERDVPDDGSIKMQVLRVPRYSNRRRS